ncbi:carcinoembryonic antigen-related cell adhesion molecule 5-like [Xiphias gladius]|uniref:carcinoembryonic antigen-related cell adhesion molecule 5-like n=1 Tax=Xiphias gladius TaxID=8245 RepID=UPI001A997988|nr:carcinoembryonic antigen-related cell adhesion molecule 5-like [Xiphias gladius]
MVSTAAAASGFVLVLLSVPVVRGYNDWGVTYASTKICALKGSTVEMNCTYRFPSGINSVSTKVEDTFWFTKASNYIYVDLRTDPDYWDRVEYRCKNDDCTLRIADLRESDSAVYRFRFITNQPGGSFTGSPGVTLSVTDLQVQVRRSDPPTTSAVLKCHSTCPPGTASYVWYKNGQKIEDTSPLYAVKANDSAHTYSCALKEYEAFHSPSVYAPKLPSVSATPSGDMVEGSSVNLTCSSDANPAANYTWYKGNQTLHRREARLVFGSIQSSDSGAYYCTAENELGRDTSECVLINVKYAPKLPSVSATPSGDIVEGSSVNLTCSSDANPAANYTWYKGNQTLLQGPEGFYHFTSISSEDRGFYRCKAENQFGRIHSTSLYLDVQYPPKLPSVSASPSGDIVEGSSVNLTCSSDANPAANYTWYKEQEDSPQASGQIFAITDYRPELGGNYYCEARNRRGRRNNTLHLTVVQFCLHTSGAWMLIAVGTITAIFFVAILISVLLWIRKRASSQSSKPEQRPDKSTEKQPVEQRDNLHYASVSFFMKRAAPLCSNVRPALLQGHEKQEETNSVEYATVIFNRDSCTKPSVTEIRKMEKIQLPK